MKKSMKLFLLAMTTLSLTACSSGKEGKENSTQANDTTEILKQNDKKETTKKIYGQKELCHSQAGKLLAVDYHEYNEYGKEIKITSYTEEFAYDGSQIKVNEYDSQNRLIKEKNYDDENLYLEAEYEYDSEGKLIKKTYFNGDRFNEGWQEFEYDDNNQMTKDWHYANTGEEYSCVEYEYDSAGNVTGTRTEYSDENSIEPEEEEMRTASERFEYDKDNQLITYIEYYRRGDVKSKEEYKYDADGNMIQNIMYGPENQICEIRDYEYFYQQGEMEEDVKQFLASVNNKNNQSEETEGDAGNAGNAGNTGNDSYQSQSADLSVNQVKKDVKRHMDEEYASFKFREVETIVKELQVTVPNESAYAIVQMDARSDVFALSLEYKLEYGYDSGWYLYNMETTSYQGGNEDNNTILGIDVDPEQAQEDMLENEEKYDFYNVEYVGDHFFGKDRRSYVFVFTANYMDAQYGECAADVEASYVFDRKTGQWSYAYNYVTGKHIPVTDAYRFVMGLDDFAWW